VQAVRSPGSTLKPFVYGMAIEKGLLCPKQVLYDVPVNLGGYSPENYDMHFNGAIPAEKALAQSLNIPAVKVLQEVGVNEFTQRLAQGGLKQIKEDEKKLGLSMILGGCGVRLEELVGLYASLANAGEFHELRYVNTDSIPFSFQWMKREAAFLVSEILTGVTRPDLPSNWQMGASVPHIAWKTGTSYGRRDAWSIGYNAEYTIGVWVGNFNNEGVPGLNGADMATPLLFRLFETLQPRSSQHWLYPPEGLAMREICSETGQVPGPYCINKSSDYFLPGISRSPTCTCREKLWVNLREHTLYCRSCAPKTGI